MESTTAGGGIQDVLLVAASTCSFLILRHMLPLCLPVPEALRRMDNLEVGHWYNVMISLVHSGVTGIWCLLCFYNNPKMAEDLINGHGQSAYNLVCISTGYFIYDVLDHANNFSLSRSWEILLHHVVVISCFGISVLIHTYVGFAVVALLVEVNSVFLHVRQLFRMAKVSQVRMIYRLNCIANLGTFVAFRICTLTWMTRWLVHNRQIPQPYHAIGSVGMAMMTIMNSVLFLRLLVKDCFETNDIKRSLKPRETVNVKSDLPFAVNVSLRNKLE